MPVEWAASISYQSVSLGKPRSLILSPLRSGGEIIGVITCQTRSPNSYSDRDLRLLETFADHIAIAVQNARLFQETQSALSETATLYSIASAASRSLELEKILDEMLERVLTSIGVESGLVSMLDDVTGKLKLTAHKGMPDDMVQSLIEHNLEGTLCFLVFKERNTVNIEDLTKDPRPEAQKLLKRGYLSYSGVPLESKGQVLGTLCTFSKNLRAKQTESLSLLEVAGKQIGIAVENANLYKQEQRRRQVADTLRDIARVVGSTLDLQEVANRMLEQLNNLIRFESATVQLISRGERRLIGATGYEAALQAERLLKPVVEDPLANEVVNSRSPLVLEDTHQDRRWEVLLENSHIRSWMGAPLLAGQEVVGILTLSDTEPSAYTQDAIELVSAVAAQVAIAIQNARLFQQSQDTLAETETLYLASAELNTAQSYEDILAVLRRHTLAGQGSDNASLNFFNTVWTKENRPTSVRVAARWAQTDIRYLER